jgi:hypothetical protein
MTYSRYTGSRGRVLLVIATKPELVDEVPAAAAPRAAQR